MTRSPVGNNPPFPTKTRLLIRLSGPAFSLSGVGLDAAVPAGPTRRVIRPGDAVLIDIPVLVEGYHVDMARTYTAGAADRRSRELHR